LAREVEAKAHRLTRRYRRARDRRATRTGRHFEVFGPGGGGRGVRVRSSPAGWKEAAPAWLEADPEGAVWMKGRGRVLRARLAGREGDVVMKRYAPVAAGRLPRALRAFRMAVALDHRGVAVPEPLFAAAGRNTAGFLLSAHVDAPDLHRFVHGPGRNAYRALTPSARRAFLSRLGRFLRDLHEAEVSHRDLKAPNLLVRGDADAGFAFCVTDLEGARLARRRIPWRRRARDLARLDASLAASRTDRLRVLTAYWSRTPEPPVAKRQFLSWIGERVAKKRGPSGRPR
ncbi:MAG: lipopolysaccharide kinase InaA family protein, partial [Planctomycetota bacterium]